jgi:hypothetical protein
MSSEAIEPIDVGSSDASAAATTSQISNLYASGRLLLKPENRLTDGRPERLDPW